MTFLGVGRCMEVLDRVDRECGEDKEEDVDNIACIVVVCSGVQQSG